MSKNIRKNNKGFTLVETLVAVGILSLSILATFTSVQGGLQSSGLAKDQVTAYYLTQEAMEYIKNIRDENALNSLGTAQVNWLYSLSATTADACWYGGSDGSSSAPQKTCQLDAFLRSVSTCSGGSSGCTNLRQNSTSGLYGYTGSWTATNFKRWITFTPIVANQEVRVTINTSWTSRGTPQSFQISELLFNRESL